MKKEALGRPTMVSGNTGAADRPKVIANEEDLAIRIYGLPKISATALQESKLAKLISESRRIFCEKVLQDPESNPADAETNMYFDIRTGKLKYRQAYQQVTYLLNSAADGTIRIKFLIADRDLEQEKLEALTSFCAARVQMFLLSVWHENANGGRETYF